jgi:hypothetical protein
MEKEIKIEMLTNTLRNLTDKYATINCEYVQECAIDYMSRRATYLDGQLAILHTLIEEVEGELDEVRDEDPDFDYDPADFEDEDDDEFINDLVDSMFEDDVDESNYDPYMGCDCFDN